jgi:hypothetical protein
MTEPFKIGCHCGFMTEDPHAFIDHCLTTQHIELPAGAEDGALAEIALMFAAVQRLGADPTAELPANAELRQLTVEDILTDDEIPEDEKEKILARFAEMRAKHKGEDPQ